MAEQEIWIFDTFEKGINTGTNSKDIESSEFVEMNDCNISQNGIIKVIGKALVDTTISPWKVDGNLIPGYGFHNFFSDYTLSPGSVILTIEHTQNASDGAKAYIQIDPIYDSSFGWYFDVQPTGGELRAVIKVNSVGIHGQLDGSGTYLTFLKGSDWDANKELVSTATHTGSDINILTAKSGYSTDYSEERWDVESLDNEEEYFLPYTDEEGHWPTTAYNGWEALFSNDTSRPDWYMPNIPNPMDLVISPHWFDNISAFWDNSSSPGTLTGDAYFYFNDNRWMFGLSTPNTGMYTIGYNDFYGYSQNENPDLWSNNNWSDYLLDFYGSLGNSQFWLPTRRVSHYYVSDYIEEESNVHLKNGIWRSFIQAINAYSGSDGTNQFTASWGETISGVANHYHDELYDTVIIKAAAGGTTLNGKRLSIDFTANSLNNSANLINSYSPTLVDSGYNPEVSVTSSITNIRLHKNAYRKFHAGEMIKLDDEYIFIWRVRPAIISGTQYTMLDVDRPWNSSHWIYLYYGGATANSHSTSIDINKFKIHTPRLPYMYNKDGNYSLNQVREDAWKRQLGNGFSWQGDYVFHGGTAATAEVKLITFSGEENSGDTVYIRVTPTGDDPTQGVLAEETISVVCSGTHEEAADEAASKLDDITNLIGSSPSNGVVRIQSITGNAGAFEVSVWAVRATANNITSQGVNEEFSALISETGTNPNDFEDEYINEWYTNQVASGDMSDLDDAWGPKYTEFEVFSKISGAWQPTIERFRLKWIYLNTLGEKNKPIMWDEGSRLRICDTNFNLKWNKNRIFGYFDLVDYFKNDELDESDWSGWTAVGDESLDKALFRMTNGEKVWEYTCGVVVDDPNDADAAVTYGTEIQDTDGNNTLNGGLWQATLPGFNHTNHYDDKPAMRLHFEKATNSPANGIDWQGTCKFYAAAIYDDGGEGLPAHQFTIGDTEAANIGNYTLAFGNTTADDDDYGESIGEVLRIFVGFKPMLHGQLAFPDLRITGIRLYYTHSEESFETYWSLGAIDFRQGFLKTNEVLNIDQMSANTERIVWTGSVDDLNSEGGADNNGTGQGILILKNPISGGHYVEFLSMPKVESFESINGYSPNNETLSVRYKAHCMAGRRSFVGNIAVKDSNGNFKYYNDRMVVSPVNQLDTFPYPSNILDLDISDGDEIIELKALGDKVLQFKKNMLYIVNISSGIPAEYFVEERHKFKGVLTRNNIVETEDGIFWVNEIGAYLYTGEEIEELHLSEDSDKNQKRILQNDWSDFVSSNSLVGYNPESKEVFVVKNSTQTSESDGDCYIYSLIVKSWTFGKNRFYCGASKTLTNMQNVGDNATLGFIYDGHIGDGPDDSGGIP